ncbi:MAG: peptide/nickel transport system substrate-binding protein [Natronomonas sp.]
MLAAGATGLTSGCLRRIRALTGWQSPDQLSLRIKTLPADADPYALPLARRIAGWFRDAGIDATVLPMAEQSLLREVLLENEFDLFVTRTPTEYRHPDALYSLLHSRFVTTPGWQNPFGYTNLEVDELLERQRRTGGSRRRAAIEDLQRRVTETQPFTVLGFADDLRAVRPDRLTNWERVDLESPIGYLALRRARDVDDGGKNADESAHLRVVSTDSRPTKNLNPLAVEFRSASAMTGLLYDTLGYRASDGTIRPWLADSWSFSLSGSGPTLRLQLRDGLAWHDGEAITADDVAFTYAFLADTSLDSGADDASEEDHTDPIPAPRFQGRVGLVADVTALDDRTVEFQFVDAKPAVVSRALTVPILPRHVWRKRTDRASMAGVDVWAATEALVANNVPPVGSGPLAFVDNTPDEELVLEAFEDHFLADGPVPGLPESVQDGPAFDRMTLGVVGTDATAVEMVDTGNADVTGTPLAAGVVPQIVRSSALDLIATRSDAFYLLGFNARRAPLTNPRFRTVLARIVDRQTLASSVFEGYARLAASPLQGTEWVPPDLQWREGEPNPVNPFPGTDGKLDVSRARDLFREAGYRYENGELLAD